MGRVEATLETAKHGLADLLDASRGRRVSGLRNLIVFGRSVTFVLQNLRSALPQGEFDAWYHPHQEAMKADPLMRYFVKARNELEKQGKLSVGMSAHIHSFSTNDISRFPRPRGAKGFFIGDQLGGSGWEVELADGTTEKYYVDIPTSLAEVIQHFTNLPDALASELKGAPVEDLCTRYIERLGGLVEKAKEQFLGAKVKPAGLPSGKQFPSYLKRVK